MKKKIFGLITIVCLIIITHSNHIANAMTAQDGANWALSRIGWEIDTDGSYGPQCKDFVNAYIQENWGFTPPGNAINLIDYNYPSGWQKIQNTPDFLPQPGDIAVWAYGSFAEDGHCGIITSANLSTFTSVDQNWFNASENGSKAALVTHNYSGFWGVIRPPFDTSQNTVDPIHQDTNPHVRNGYFTFKNVSSGKFMQVYSGADQNTQPIDMWDFDGSDDQRFNVVHHGNGKYKLYAECSSYGSNRVVDIFRNGASPAEGQLVDLYDPNDDTAQLFYIWPVSDGEYVFELASKNGYVICPRDSSAAAQNGYTNGSQLILQKYTGSSHQKWKLCNNSGKETTPNISYSSGSYKIETDGDGLNMRTGASSSSSLIMTIPDGTVLSVTQVNSNWGYTSYGGNSGWVCLDFTTYTVTLNSISISKKPDKTSYFTGDKFDSSGMEISANYSNGQTELIGSGFSVDCDLNSAGTKTVNVSYKGKTTSFTVEVQELLVNSISLYSTDIKKEYYVGEAVVLEEIGILANYNNGSANIITSGFTADYDFSSAGTKTVTISYGGKSTSYDVTVLESDESTGSTWLVNSVSCYMGNEVVVPITLSSDNICDGNITFQYDSSKLQIVDFSIGTQLAVRNAYVNTSYDTDKIRVTFAGTSNFIADNDKIITFRFKTLDSGIADIKITDINMYNSNGQTVATNITNGTVTIIPVVNDVDVSNIQSQTSNGKKIVTADLSDNNVLCFLVRYENGIMTECDMQSPTDGHVQLSVMDNGSQIKFMVWNHAMKALTNARNIY